MQAEKGDLNSMQITDVRVRKVTTKFCVNGNRIQL